jgi:hypothetical protein
VKVLLDEDAPHMLRLHLPGDVFTVAYLGWSGLKNGELLKTAPELERFGPRREFRGPGRGPRL